LTDSNRIYLDHNATTPPSPAVMGAVVRTMEQNWGNPSSIHWTGQQARRALEKAREQVAGLIGAAPEEIVFMSGGSESVNAAIRSALAVGPDRRVVVTSEVEHSAVRELMQHLVPGGIEWVQLKGDDSGRVDPSALEALLAQRANEIALVSVMWANNETGVIEPIDQIAACCERFGVLCHSDGTQWVGKMPTAVEDLPLSYLSFAGHKFHGPKGTGVLWARRGCAVAQTVIGGGQEQGRRGGTEHVPGCVGLGVAAQEALEWLDRGGHLGMPALRDRFEDCVRTAIPGACVNGERAPRMWSTSSIGFPDVEAELMLLVLSERGVDASAGSACGSGALKESSVLSTMGAQPCQIPSHTYGSVRFSWCRETTWDQLGPAVNIIGGAMRAIAGIEDPSERLLAD